MGRWVGVIMSYPLYISDWGKYPTARPHLTTSNKSAIRLVTSLKRMEIKNHLLPLMLVDQELLKINPHSKNLTLNEKSRIVAECVINPWYFFREVLRAPASSGGATRPFRLTRGNFAMYWLFFNHITTINIWPRQEGKSFCMDCLDIYLMNVACKNTSFQLLTKDDDLRTANITRLKEIEEALPSYMRRRGKFDARNNSEYTVKALKNRYKGHLPSLSPKRAYKVGRGLTSAMFRIDELVFQPNIGLSLPSALTAGKMARQLAKEAGAPYGTVMTTTAGKLDDTDGKWVYAYMNKGVKMTEKFYDSKNEEKLIAAIRGNGNGALRVDCTYNHRQLGTTDAQLLEAIEESGIEGADLLADFYNVWNRGNVRSPYSHEVTVNLGKSRRDPVYVEVNEDQLFTNWYVKKKLVHKLLEKGDVIVGLDTSDAIGEDDIALVARSISSGKVLGVGTYNTTNIITFSKWLFERWLKPYPKCIFIIERRSTASSIIDYLLLMLQTIGRNPFKQLWNRVVDDHIELPHRFAELHNYRTNNGKNMHIKFKRYVGFSTSGSGKTSRTALYKDNLHEVVGRFGPVLADRTMIDQLLALEVSNNRIDHPDGGNDDTVIALLLTQWFLSKATNVAYYGINPLKVLSKSDINSIRAIENVEDRMNALRDKATKKKIDKIIKKARKVHDPIMVRKIQHMITNLTALLNDPGEHYSIDALLEQMKKQQKINSSKQFQRNNTKRQHDIQMYLRHRSSMLKN